MTKSRFRFGIFLVVLSTTVQVSLITVGSVKMNHKYGTIGTLPLNILVLVGEVLIYLKTIYNLQRYKKERQKKLKESDTSLVKLAALYLLMILIFFIPFMVINTIYGYTSPFSQSFRRIQYTWLMSQLIYVCNSFANAITFLRINRKGRLMMAMFLQRSVKMRFNSTSSLNFKGSPNVIDIKNWRSPTISSTVSSFNDIVTKETSS